MKQPDDMSREELEEEVAFLRSETVIADDSDRLAHWRALGLRTSAARVMFALQRASPRILTKNHLLEIASCGDINRYRSDKIAHVYICAIRKLLGADSIENRWAHGYLLTASGVSAVRALDRQSIRRGEAG